MPTYTDSHTGTPVNPVDASYLALAMSVDTTLVWPNLSDDTNDVLARIIEVTPSGGGLSLILPAANEGGVGEDSLIINRGASAFTLKDSAGGTVASIGAGEARYVYLTDNSTVAGSWRIFTFGTGTSSADASALAGAGLVANGAVLDQTNLFNALAADYTVATADRSKMLVYTSGSWTVSLPLAANQADNGFFFSINNAGSGTITLDPAGAETIDGAASMTLAPGESCVVHAYKTGAAWYTVGRGRSTTFDFSYLVKNVAGNVDVTLSPSEAANKLVRFTGALTGNISVFLPNVPGAWFVNNDTSGAFTLAIKAGTGLGGGPTITQGTRDIVVCYGDTSNSVYQAVNNTVLSAAFNAGSALNPSIFASTDSNTGGYWPAADEWAVTCGGVQRSRWSSSGQHITGSLDVSVDITTPTQAAGTNTTQVATTAFVTAAVSALIPSGTRMLFQQTAAPTGWTKDTNATYNDSALRVVTGAASTGGAVGFTTAFAAGLSSNSYTLGIGDIPSHTHTGTTAAGGVDHTHSGTTAAGGVDHTHYTSGNTGTESADHAHYTSGTTSTNGSHNHWFNLSNGPGGSDVIYVGSGLDVGTTYVSTEGDHAHTWGAWSGGINNNHTHSWGGTSGGASAYSHTHTFGTGGATAYSHTHTFTSDASGGGGGHSHGLPSFAVKYTDIIIAQKN